MEREKELKIESVGQLEKDRDTDPFSFWQLAVT